jgi:hypothetical protein
MNAYRAYDHIEERRWAQQQNADEKDKWIDDRAKEIISIMPKDLSTLFLFSIPASLRPGMGLSSDKAREVYNDLISAIAYAQAEYEWDHRTGCPF